MRIVGPVWAESTYFAGRILGMRSRFAGDLRIMCGSPRTGRGVDSFHPLTLGVRLIFSLTDQPGAPNSTVRHLAEASPQTICGNSLALFSAAIVTGGREWVSWFFALIVTLTWLGMPHHAQAAGASAVIDGTPSVGWDGNYLVGRWTLVVVPVEVKQAGPIHCTVTAVDPDGNRVQFHSPEVSLEPGHHRLITMIKVGRLDSDITVTINGIETRGSPGRTEWLQKPQMPSVRVVLTVGNPRGFEFDGDSVPANVVAKVVPVREEDLATNPLAYDGLASLVISPTAKIAPAQADAIRGWVQQGGRLVISLRNDPAAARRFLAMFGDWIPVTIENDPATVREFGSLELLSGKKARVPHTSTLSIPGLKASAGDVLAASRSDAFVIEVPHGIGAVTVMAIDLTAAPFSEWTSLPALCARLSGIRPIFDRQEKMQTKGSQLSSTGITDLASQLAAIQDHFEKIPRISPWTAIGILVLFLLIVGPVDYLIVSRILKRTYLTWVTFPLFIVVAAAIASMFATALNGTVRRANQLDIVNYDLVTKTATSRHFVSLYSPTTSQVSVAVQPVPLVAASDTKPASMTTWSGTPESIFGGMFRESGIELATTYEQQVDGQISQLPVIQWSSKSLVATSVQSADGLVDCDLHASATGRLTGTLSHRLPGKIEDFLVVYGNVVYRSLKKKDDVESLPLAPKEIWRVDQPSVYTRDLRPYLTGIITMATPRFGAVGPEITQRQSSYDMMSLDPYSLLRILTFHEEIGGDRYTGLKNQLLEEEDLSHLLRLGRAILFGRLSEPVATIMQDGESFEPDRQDRFIRLIMPVTRSAEKLKELRRVVPE